MPVAFIFKFIKGKSKNKEDYIILSTLTHVVHVCFSAKLHFKLYIQPV